MEITKEYLKNKFLSNYNFSFCSMLLIIAIITTLGYWLKTENFFLTAIMALSLFSIFVVYCLVSRKNKKNFNFSNLYIVEDVFINIKKKTTPYRYPDSIRMHFIREHTIKFSKNGEYKLQSHEKSEPDDTDTDYITVTYSKPGDKFYLAILENKGKRKIIDCFNQKYFKISDTDFEFIDGKYMCKQ